MFVYAGHTMPTKMKIAFILPTTRVTFVLENRLSLSFIFVTDECTCRNRLFLLLDFQDVQKLSENPKQLGNLKVFRKYQCQVVWSIVRSFEEIQLTMFEKYSKRRSDPDFCDGQAQGGGILLWESNFCMVQEDWAITCGVSFLAVQNSSIGDLVTDWLTDWLTESLREGCTKQKPEKVWSFAKPPSAPPGLAFLWKI